MKKYFLSSFVALIVGIVGIVVMPQLTHAADKADFNAGYIIDDYVFYNSGAMDSTQIQNFLNSKNPNCDYDGTQPASDWGYPNWTHAQFAQYKREGSHGLSQDTGFNAPPYRCLTRYSQDTPQMEAASGYCAAIGAGTRTAAQIINDIAKACGINPQVLIVLLEKEQSLVTDNWPLNRQLQNATGFACPDTAPCNPAYEGFFYQVYYAARQFKVYQANPNNYNYRAGRNNTVYYNPGPTVNGVKQSLSYCGSSQLYIQNQATAALYIYTPYQPNQAALNNLYGTGDTCSSYGNRNFWRIFTDWFGNTHVSYTSLDTPRWMVLAQDTPKYDPGLGKPATDSTTLTAGTQLKFVDKTLVNGVWYLRTDADAASGLSRGIPQSSITEIQPVSLDTPRYMQLNSNRNKWNPLTGYVDTSTSYSNGTAMFFADKILVNGNWFFRTQQDKAANKNLFVTSTGTNEVSYVPLDTPRYMLVTNNTHKLDPITGVTGTAVSAGTQIKFTTKVLINGVAYFRSADDATANVSSAVPSSDVTEIPYQNLPSGPTWMLLTQGTLRYQPSSQTTVDGTYVNGNQQVLVSQQITVNGTVYYRTAWNQNYGQDLAIPASDFTSIPYVSLDTPRTLTLKTATTKINPLTGKPVDGTLAAGYALPYKTKILVNGVWYLRTESDTNNNLDKGIPIDKLNIP